MHVAWRLISALSIGIVQVRASGRRRAIYLTFDDGPHPDHTPEVLRLLSTHGARASFFMKGDAAARHPGLVRQICADGHTLGNHSFTHPNFRKINIAQQRGEIDGTDRELGKADGRRRHLFRPPHGEPAISTIALCMARRQPMTLWTHDSYDFRLSAAQVVDRFADLKLRPGDILLFHDDGGAAGAALRILLPKWRAQGFRFEAL